MTTVSFQKLQLLPLPLFWGFDHLRVKTRNYGFYHVRLTSYFDHDFETYFWVDYIINGVFGRNRLPTR